MTCCATRNSDEKMTNESTLTVYGIRSCDTCRRAQKYLTEHNIEFRFHDVRADGLDIQTLERWSDRIGWEKLLNRQSLTWRKIPEIDKAQITRSRALGTMIEQPTLIKRPVLESKEFIAVGFSEKRFAAFVDGLS
jgi:arsenate reductase